MSDRIDISSVKALVGDTVRLIYDIKNYKYYVKTVTKIMFETDGTFGSYAVYYDENGDAFVHHDGINHVEKI